MKWEGLPVRAEGGSIQVGFGAEMEFNHNLLCGGECLPAAVQTYTSADGPSGARALGLVLMPAGEQGCANTCVAATSNTVHGEYNFFMVS